MFKRTKYAVAVSAMALALTGVVAQPAMADEPNCSSGRDGTASWKFWANCTNRAHRVGVTCHTQSKGNITKWGEWQNPNVRSVVYCPDDTNGYSGLGADYPD